MLPTRITDRFGNAVVYTYDSAAPWKLLSMSSGEAAGSARTLSFTYLAGAHQIASVSDSSSTRTYSYGGSGVSAIPGNDTPSICTSRFIRIYTTIEWILLSRRV